MVLLGMKFGWRGEREIHVTDCEYDAAETCSSPVSFGVCAWLGEIRMPAMVLRRAKAGGGGEWLSDSLRRGLSGFMVASVVAIVYGCSTVVKVYNK